MYASVAYQTVLVLTASQPRELDIDPQTGMKNYIANGMIVCNEIRQLSSFPTENGSWDTSKALVRRTLEHCIHLGRQHRANGRKEDEYEAYRLLGQAVCYDHSRSHLF